jgi:alanine racemase
LSRPTVAEISLKAIAHNLAEVRRLIGPDVKICPAVKADAYGHGAVEVSRALLKHGVAMLGIATVEEGIELRTAGIDSPLLLLGCVLPEDIPDILTYNITATVCDFEFAGALSRKASAEGKRAKIHIKVDTGMGRIGVQADKAVDFALTLSRMPGLEIEGIFTHFPCADESDLNFTLNQIRQFRDIVEKIELAGVHIPIKHTSNSGAILNVPEAHMDMVRPGIMLYGLYDSPYGRDRVNLLQAMTLKTKIVFLKKLPPGCGVSYGRTFVTSRHTVVATIPVGYGDGYNRGLSNRAWALVHGRRVPVIGRVCMDQTMLDVTDVPNVCVGDEVVLYGKQGSEEIRIEEIASLLGTISYEVVCAVSKRVPRVYLD